MKLIMDACTGILLAKCSVLEKATEQFMIYITDSVKEEILAGKEKMFADALLLERLCRENKIKSIVDDAKKTSRLMSDFNMERGEASVISAGLACEAIVATDNNQGRKAAKVNNLSLTGSVEIVVSLNNKKVITKDKALASLDNLRKYGWFDEYIIQMAKEDIK